MVLITRAMPLTGKVDASLLPQGTSFLFVGDVHGQWQATTRLLSALSRIADRAAPRVLVTLGDIVHKGPQSRRCLRAALGDEFAERAGADTHIRLLGNHEILLARALIALEQGREGRPWIAAWAKAGGLALLSSWSKDRPGTLEDRLARWRDGFPVVRLAGLGAWLPSWTCGNLHAVHAGVDPESDNSAMGAMDAYVEARPRLRKHSTHWATIRAPFLDHAEGFGGRLVVHGHTPHRALFTHPPKTGHEVGRILDRTASHGRLCLDGGSGYNIGVAGALVENGTFRIAFAPC